ncbi:MAG: IS110 family transposase [Gemmatimonadales bacterium]
MAKIRLEAIPEQEAPRAAVRPTPGTPVCMAIDVSRSKLVYCVRWNGAEQRRLSTPAELGHLQAVVAQYRECQLHVAYEACGFGYEPAWWLQEQQIAVTVIAPSRVERAPGLGVKTDRMDAGKLARKLEKGELKGIYIPPRPVHAQRQLGRTYGQYVRERQRAQIRIRSLLQEQGRLGPEPSAGWSAYRTWVAAQELPAPVRACVQAHEQVRALADRQAHGLRRELMQLARSATYRPLVQALCGQAGVGPLSAIRLVLELGSIDRFASGAALAHYLGLTPSQYSSGELDHRGHILKCGPGALRGLLLQCAWAAVRPGRDAALRAVFERIAPRRGRKRAIVAVARRLAVQLHRRWWAVQHPAESAPVS